MSRRDQISHFELLYKWYLGVLSSYKFYNTQATIGQVKHEKRWFPCSVQIIGKTFNSLVYDNYINYPSQLPGSLSDKETVCQCRSLRFDPCVEKIRWRRKWQPTPVFLPGKCHGQRNLEGYSPWGHKRVKHDSEWTTMKIVLAWTPGLPEITFVSSYISHLEKYFWEHLKKN